MIARTAKSAMWVLLRTVYRIEVHGRANIPDGPAILTPNHVSYIDAILIAAHIQRPMRFAMYWKIYNRTKWLVAPMGAFPIASRKENQAVYNAAFVTMSRALHAGELVCLFPEGMITLDGHMNEFKHGISKVLESSPVPVVPIGLRGLWGSYFSKKKRGLFKLPDHFMAKIEMVVGVPLAPTVPVHELELAVADLL